MLGDEISGLLVRPLEWVVDGEGWFGRSGQGRVDDPAGDRVAAGCVIGWLIGSALDRHFGTHWMMIAGILLGAVAGFVRIFQMARGYLKRGDVQ
jgi:uncharacterized membrane protein YfcA